MYVLFTQTQYKPAYIRYADSVHASIYKIEFPETYDYPASYNIFVSAIPFWISGFIQS